MMDGAVDARRFRLTCAPVRDEAGQVSAMLVLAFASTEPPYAPAAVAEELRHRVRNVLAVVRSLIARSAETSDTVQDLAAHLDGRIAAVTRVQSVLMRNPRAGVDLEDLIRDELLAQSADDERVKIEGPRISLPAKAAELLTLAIHELATNALKFGALSQASGNLQVTWRLEGTRTSAGRLELVWLESGVRVASSAPRREGFGTNLLKRRLPYELAGKAEIEFRPGGLVCQIAFPFTPAEDALAGEVTRVDAPEDLV
jgi:two-component sensor histidine kinase